MNLRNALMLLYTSSTSLIVGVCTLVKNFKISGSIRLEQAPFPYNKSSRILAKSALKLKPYTLAI